MKPIILIPIAIYWVVIGLIFSIGLSSPLISAGFTGNTNITDEVELGEATGFGVGDFFNILKISVLGVGLPDDVPSFVSIPYALWSWLLLFIFIIGVIA